MFRPSAAPRWKMTTRRLLPIPASTAPNAARVRKLGTAAVPTTASALLRRKMRRVIDMVTRSWPLALSFWLPASIDRDETRAEGRQPKTRFISSETRASLAADRRLCLRRAAWAGLSCLYFADLYLADFCSADPLPA